MGQKIKSKIQILPNQNKFQTQNPKFKCHKFIPKVNAVKTFGFGIFDLGLLGCLLFGIW